MEVVAWTCAVGGLLLGGLAAFVPGFPGSAVALLGLVAFAGLTGFEILTREALVLAAAIALVGALGQLVAPVVASRAAGGTAGAATGAALGAVIGSLMPLPGSGILGAIVGALLLGWIGSRRRLLGWVRGVIGAGGGCIVSAAADGLAVLGLGAVLGLADFLRALP